MLMLSGTCLLEFSASSILLLLPSILYSIATLLFLPAPFTFFSLTITFVHSASQFIYCSMWFSSRYLHLVASESQNPSLGYAVYFILHSLLEVVYPPSLVPCTLLGEQENTSSNRSITATPSIIPFCATPHTAQYLMRTFFAL